MSERSEFPSVEAREVFARKVGQFRAVLPPGEQRMLDAMVIAAFAPHAADDVEGYQAFYGGPEYVPHTSSYNPWWYNGSGAAAWDQTPWGTAIGGLQAPYHPYVGR